MELTTSGFGTNSTEQTCDCIYIYQLNDHCQGLESFGESPAVVRTVGLHDEPVRLGLHEVRAKRIGFEKLPFPSNFRLICAGSL